MTPLRQRMINDMTVRGLAENTKRSYLTAVTGLARHYRRSPDQISAQEVQDYLIYLHQQRGLSWELQLRAPRRALPVPHYARCARPALLCARRQDTFHSAPDSQPRRAGAAVHRHHQPQASLLADDGLCRGASPSLEYPPYDAYAPGPTPPATPPGRCSAACVATTWWVPITSPPVRSDPSSLSGPPPQGSKVVSQDIRFVSAPPNRLPRPAPAWLRCRSLAGGTR